MMVVTVQISYLCSYKVYKVTADLPAVPVKVNREGYAFSTMDRATQVHRYTHLENATAALSDVFACHHRHLSLYAACNFQHVEYNIWSDAKKVSLCLRVKAVQLIWLIPSV